MEALAAGEVGVLLVAGGQGSRLGFEQPKGMYPIGPVSRATLLQIHFEKALAAARRYGAADPALHDDEPGHARRAGRRFSSEHDRFGLPEDDVVLSSARGRCRRSTRRRASCCWRRRIRSSSAPTATAARSRRWRRAGRSTHMRRRGIEHLFYLQVDNPLAPICDRGVHRLSPAREVGAHVDGGREAVAAGPARQFRDDRRPAAGHRVQRLPG